MAIAVVGTPIAVELGSATSVDTSVDAGTGSDRVLYSSAYTESGVVNRNISSQTYNGVTGVEILDGTGAGGNLDDHVITHWINPATGTNTLTTNIDGGSSQNGMAALCFSGVDQTTPDDTPDQATGGSTAPALTLAHGGGDDVIYNHVVTPTTDVVITADSPNTEEASVEDPGSVQASHAIGWKASADPAWTFGTSAAWSVVGVNVNAAAGGQTVAVGQVTEANLAQAVTWAPKHRLVGQVVEAELAQPIAALKSLTITQVTETDLAQAIGRIKTRSVAQVVEVDLAQSITPAGDQTVAVGQVTEANLAQPVGRLKTRTFAQAVEADLAQAVARVKAKSVGQVTETDLGQAIAWAPKHRLVGQALETDTTVAIVVIAGVLGSLEAVVTILVRLNGEASITTRLSARSDIEPRLAGTPDLLRG